MAATLSYGNNQQHELGMESKVNASVFDEVVDRTNTHSMKWEKYRGKDVIPMWVADMDFAVAEPIQKAIVERVGHPVYGYTGAPDSMRQSIADHLDREYGWKINLDWLVFLPGVVTGLAVSCRAYCNDNDKIMVNPPIYHHFYDAHEAKRQTLVKVPLEKRDNKRWTYNFEAMQNACSKDLSMLMMCSPHNPTGTVFEREELQRVASMCVDNDMMIISDEIHCDLVIDKQAKHIPTAVACPEQADRIVTLMSASKTWNIAGLNTSFAIIENKEKRDQFVTACPSIVPMTTPIALAASEAAYAQGGPWREALLDYLWGNYKKIETHVATMPGLTLEPLQATYLAWIDATDLALDDTQAHFEQHGVGLSSGEQFGQPNFIRLNFACSASVLEEGLLRMRSAIDALGKA